jgi:hypothetical protein
MARIALVLALAIGLLATGASASTELASKTVLGQANIFGAGRGVAPEPGGGGGGVLPPGWRLPEGSGRVVTFPQITGKVTPIVGEAPYNAAGGDHRGPTNIESLKGISGIMHFTNGMFLVGVFLSDSAPTRPAPPRFDFTETERFKVLAPRIGQTFLIGDGKGRSYRVPPRATRLFVGFADGFFYQGAPGWYGNNDGQLRVRVNVTK